MQWLWKEAMVNQEGYGTFEMLVMVAAVATIAGVVATTLKGILFLINDTATGKITGLHGSGY